MFANLRSEMIPTNVGIRVCPYVSLVQTFYQTSDRKVIVMSTVNIKYRHETASWFGNKNWSDETPRNL